MRHFIIKLDQMFRHANMDAESADSVTDLIRIQAVLRYVWFYFATCCEQLLVAAATKDIFG